MAQCVSINNQTYCPVDNARRIPFQQRCDAANGTVQWNDNGVLLQCAQTITRPGEAYKVLFTEIDVPHQQEHFNILSKHNIEKERLVWYFHTVYPNTTDDLWRSFSLVKLQSLYQSLEIFYDLPSNYDPQTAIPRRRPRGAAKFFRVPASVEIEQSLLTNVSQAYPDNSWVEVSHFGPMNLKAFLPDSSYFTGNYYYVTRGSGVFLNIGKTLRAWNKIHALKQLGVPNAKILELSGYLFKKWLTLDTNALLQSNPGLSYDAAKARALDSMIAQIANGTSIRKLPGSDIVEFYGLGGSTEGADAYLALNAVGFGYDSIQLIREAQVRPSPSDRIANVGFELIHLQVPSASARTLYVGYRASANGISV